MICKNCGAQLSDNSIFCGNCGAAQNQPQPQQPAGFGENIPNPAPPVGNSGFQPVTPVFNPNPTPTNGGFNPPGGTSAAPNVGGLKGLLQNKNNIIVIAIPVVALILVAAIIIGVVSVIGSNPDNTIDRYMTAFIDCDGEAMSAEVSKSLKNAVVYFFETANIAKDGELKKQVGGDFNEFTEQILEESFENESKKFFENFEYELGSKYNVEYEITAEEKADKDELKKFNEIISRLSGQKLKVNGLMLADITVNGKSGSDKYESNMTLFLCKDGSKWQILSISNYGYDFEDYYDSFNFNGLMNMF